jgi:hypothetical protein
MAANRRDHRDPSGKEPKLGVLKILRRHLQEAEHRATALDAFCEDLRLHIGRFEEWLTQIGHPNGEDHA